VRSAILTVFSCGKQVLKVAGHDLSADRSGKKTSNAVPIISKRGKAGLRYAIYQAAHLTSPTATQISWPITPINLDRGKEKGIGTKMQVKLAAKLLIIAWIRMKKKEVFDSAYLNMEDTQV
jgi:transposase